ncbi:SLATT domain-containing protein [Oribacterium sinus]|uniref:SLATT domain-containing protein n=1 Tax=Oribacterium sinus TaxID=237576 RepID=UPI0028ECBB71|nr:SLATT domain-containing protein [Oribacterium sinus]
MNNEYQLLLDEVRQNYSSVVWTHKIQEKQADIYHEKYAKLEAANILVASATSCGIVSTIFCDNIWAKIIAAALSFVTITITAYFKSFDIKEMEKQNKKYANKFLVIRNRLLHIICDIHMKKRNVDEINLEYISIMDDLNELYTDAPSTTQDAVDRAFEALKVNKEYTISDEEIDNFLPPTLRGKVE